MKYKVLHTENTLHQKQNYKLITFSCNADNASRIASARQSKRLVSNVFRKPIKTYNICALYVQADTIYSRYNFFLNRH